MLSVSQLYTQAGEARPAGSIQRAKRQRLNSFTLVEMMVATLVLVILMGIIATTMNSARITMTRAQANIGAFATARSSFENMSDKLSQATLNTYWDYYNSTGSKRTDANFTTFVPATYGRASDMQFLVRQNIQNSGYGHEVYFQAPVAFSTNANYISTQGLLNACGYYVQYCSDASYHPSVVATATQPSHTRYRLMQGMELTESLSVFNDIAGASFSSEGSSPTWISNIKNSGSTTINSSTYVVPVADNVIALIVWPRQPLRQDSAGTALLDPTTHAYTYNSQLDYGSLPTSSSAQKVWDDQLPPIVQLTMVVIDEPSAARIEANSTLRTSLETILSSGSNGSALFLDATKYASDLAVLTNFLNTSTPKLNYQVLNSSVIMRECKWTQ
jgi:uncharacterized protein (TIGR02599 family)